MLNLNISKAEALNLQLVINPVFLLVPDSFLGRGSWVKGVSFLRWQTFSLCCLNQTCLVSSVVQMWCGVQSSHVIVSINKVLSLGFFICHYYAVSSQSLVYLSELLILERGQNATPNILSGSGHCYFVFLLQRTPSMGRVTAVTIGWTGTQKNIQTVKVGFPLDS